MSSIVVVAEAWNWGFARSVPGQLGDGILTTIKASLGASAVAIVLGLVWSIVRYSRVPVLSWIVAGVVQILRGSPLLVQLYFAFYVLPKFGLTFSPLITGILGLGVYFSAFTSEVYRGAIVSIPAGQWEAAKALNMSWGRTWWRVVLPQVGRLTVPPIGNYVIAMFKDSALLSAITAQELLATANNIASLQYRYVEPLTIAGLIYLVISYPASRGIRYLENHMGRIG
jgi:polar amino acid transport system permease protein